VYEDLGRPPLRAAPLRRALEPEGWRLEIVPEATSTNALVAERARAGEPAGLVVVAEHQSAGRGRLDRTWSSPPRAGLTLSVLLRPPALTGWLPLLAGVAVVRALRAQAEVDAFLKWPNDVLLDGRKVCGVLVEVAGDDAAVVGMGLNVTTRQDELPVPGATSLALSGSATTDRDTLLRALLRELRSVFADEPAAKEAYRNLCSSIGAQVRVEPAGRAPVTGRAEGVDDSGRLVVAGRAYSAGDVVHVRPVR
jgi:BirA family biotin operon repressor/biotin-[acetyl-CoA-carboxylase] ligase